MKNTIAIIGGTGRAGKFLAKSAVKKRLQRSYAS